MSIGPVRMRVKRREIPAKKFSVLWTGILKVYLYRTSETDRRRDINVLLAKPNKIHKNKGKSLRRFTVNEPIPRTFEIPAREGIIQGRC